MAEVYLDNNATTALDGRVFAVMQEELCGPPANPSSVHRYGRAARNRLTMARREIAEMLGVAPQEVLFTSGGTEGLSLALNGCRGHIITSNLEHPALLAPLEGHPGMTILSPGPWGAPTCSQVEEALRPDTTLIALMAANNETGVKTDIDAIAALAEERGISLVIDGVALMGKELFSIPPGVSAMVFSGHKFHGPKGSGLLVVRPHFKLRPQLFGGPQEGLRRAGTENLAGILGMAKAVELLREELPGATQHMARLRDRLEVGIRDLCPEARVNGEGPRLCNTSNIAFGSLEAEGLMMRLDLKGVAVSHGSACSSGSLEPSRVLLNMGYSRERAASSLRFSLSRMTTDTEIEQALGVLAHCLDRDCLRA